MESCCSRIYLITKNISVTSDSDAEPTPINKRGSSYREQYQSNRRPITQDEIKNALHLAQEASSNETFLVVMRPTHVYRRFFVVNVIYLKLFFGYVCIPNFDYFVNFFST